MRLGWYVEGNRVTRSGPELLPLLAATISKTAATFKSKSGSSKDVANVNSRDTRWENKAYHVKALSILVRMVCLVHEMEACIISAERLDRRAPATFPHLGTIILYRKWGGELMAAWV